MRYFRLVKWEKILFSYFVNYRNSPNNSRPLINRLPRIIALLEWNIKIIATLEQSPYPLTFSLNYSLPVKLKWSLIQ